MNSVTAILEPDETGTIHLKLPDAVWSGTGKVQVVATPVEEADPAGEARRQKALAEITTLIHRRDPFRNLQDPAEWQRNLREDRQLPERD